MSAIKGLDSFFDVLAVINDPAKYEAKLTEIKKATDDYKVVVESVVKLSEVNDYTVNIKKSKEDAEAALISAKMEADSIRTAAMEEAKTRKQSVKNLETKNASKAVELSEREQALLTKEEEQQMKDKVLMAKEVSLNSREEDLNKFKQDLDQRAAKLRAALA